MIELFAVLKFGVLNLQFIEVFSRSLHFFVWDFFAVAAENPAYWWCPPLLVLLHVRL